MVLVGKWMQLEITMLSKISYSKIQILCIFSYVQVFKRHASRTGSIWEEWGTSGGREGEQERILGVNAQTA